MSTVVASKNSAFALLLLVGLLAVTGCSAGSVADQVRDEASQSATPTTEPEPEFDSNAVTKEFVTAIYASDFDTAKLLASPDSPGARYVTHQEATSKAYQVNGQPGTAEQPTLTFDEGSVTGTYSEGSSFVWSDFKFDDRGLVTSWTTPSGDLTGLLWMQDWSGTVGANTYTLVSSYKANSGDLYVTIRVDAGQNTTLFPYTSSLVGADSINYSVNSALASGPTNNIPAGSSAFVVLVFPQAPFGGTAHLQGFYTDDASSTIDVAIPVA